MSKATTSVNPDAIRSMFSAVASSYDKANSILSLGIHHLWRRKLVQLSQAKPGDSVLDCATGTGDLAIAFKQIVGDSGKVLGTDFCAEMLEFAPKKALQKNLEIDFQLADVTALQYKSESFDICSISFGIRNVANPVLGLSEMSRVLKPGGRLMVLEFGQMNLPIIKDLYAFYSEKVLPKIGGLITGQTQAYEYLQKSSKAFPCKENFVSWMNQTGTLENCTYHSLSGGIAYIYIGHKKSL